MKIKMIYENKYQMLEVDSNEVSAWLNIDTDMAEEDLQKCVQEKIDKLYNRPDYNNWHKFDRHRGEMKKPFRRDDESEDITEDVDYIADNTDEIARNRQYDYDDLCQKIRSVLKPNYAEVLISIVLDEKSPEDYAAETGDTREAVYKRLQRAKKKFEKIF